jgi:hypothetical protein
VSFGLERIWSHCPESHRSRPNSAARDSPVTPAADAPRASEIDKSSSNAAATTASALLQTISGVLSSRSRVPHLQPPRGGARRVFQYFRFRYASVWFSVVDPWPQYLSDDLCDNDDVCIDLSENSYHPYDRRYPRDRIVITVYVNYRSSNAMPSKLHSGGALRSAQHDVDLVHNTVVGKRNICGAGQQLAVQFD